METTVVNPSPVKESGGSIGIIIGLVVLVVAGYLFYVYGFPVIKQVGSLQTAPQINIPGKIDVNINQTK